MGVTLLEGSGEELGLSVESGCSGVIPNEVVGLGDLGREGELRGDDPFDGFGGEMAMFEQPRALRGRRAGDDDYGGKMAFGLGFVKQGNIRAEPLGAARRILRQIHPPGADGGMQDLFKSTAFGGIGKDDFAQTSAIRLALGIQNFRSKCRGDRLLDAFIFREQRVRAAIGIKKLHRQILAQSGGEDGLSRTDASSDPKGWHRPGDYLGMSGSSSGAISGGAMVSTTSSLSSSERTSSPAGLINFAETKMMRLVLRC